MCRTHIATVILLVNFGRALGWLMKLEIDHASTQNAVPGPNVQASITLLHCPHLYVAQLYNTPYFQRENCCRTDLIRTVTDIGTAGFNYDGTKACGLACWDVTTSATPSNAHGTNGTRSFCKTPLLCYTWDFSPLDSQSPTRRSLLLTGPDHSCASSFDDLPDTVRTYIISYCVSGVRATLDSRHRSPG